MPDEHDELLAEMDRRLAAHPRRQRAKTGPKGRARSKTLFPGQLMICGVCGAPFYWCGNKALRCANMGNPARGSCWNHIQVDAGIVRRRILDVLFDILDDQPGVKASILHAAVEECKRLAGRHDRGAEALRKEVARLSKEKVNLAEAIRRGGEMDVLVEQLQQADERLRRAAADLRQAEGQADANPTMATERDAAEHLAETMAYLMAESYEFSELLRRVIPVFRIVPLQAVDTGRPVPRAYVTFSFAGLADRTVSLEYQPRPEDFSVVLDLFERPAHIQCLKAAVQLHQEHPDWNAQKIAEAIGPDVRRWSVQLALKQWKKMRAVRAIEPYVPITNPASVSRWRQQNSHRARWDQTK